MKENESLGCWKMYLFAELCLVDGGIELFHLFGDEIPPYVVESSVVRTAPRMDETDRGRNHELSSRVFDLQGTPAPGQSENEDVEFSFVLRVGRIRDG